MSESQFALILNSGPPLRRCVGRARDVYVCMYVSANDAIGSARETIYKFSHRVRK